MIRQFKILILLFTVYFSSTAFGLDRSILKEIEVDLIDATDSRVYPEDRYNAARDLCKGSEKLHFFMVKECKDNLPANDDKIKFYKEIVLLLGDTTDKKAVFSKSSPFNLRMLGKSDKDKYWFLREQTKGVVEFFVIKSKKIKEKAHLDYIKFYHSNLLEEEKQVKKQVLAQLDRKRSIQAEDGCKEFMSTPTSTCSTPFGSRSAFTPVSDLCLGKFKGFDSLLKGVAKPCPARSRDMNLLAFITIYPRLARLRLGK